MYGTITRWVFTKVISFGLQCLSGVWQQIVQDGVWLPVDYGERLRPVPVLGPSLIGG